MDTNKNTTGRTEETEVTNNPEKTEAIESYFN
jgi:hypothetical protein